MAVPSDTRKSCAPRRVAFVNVGVLNATMDKYEPGGHDLQLGIQ